MVSEEFLRSKLNALLEYWKTHEAFGWGGARCDNDSFIHCPTQVYETESGELRFTLWNMIRNFNGHYDCVVNIDTFRYSIKQSAGYGSLTWTTLPTDHKVYKDEDLTEAQRIEIDASIAKTLIRCFYAPIGWGSLNIVNVSLQMSLGHVTSSNLLLP